MVVPVPSGHNFSEVEKDMMLCFASGKYFATAEGYTISDIRFLSKEMISVVTCLIYSYLIDARNSYAKYFLEKINKLLPEEIIDRFICLVVSNSCNKVQNFQLKILGDGVLLAVNNFRKGVVKAFFISFTKSEDIYMAILNA